MAQQNFRNYLAPDFQASSQPMMEWLPWEDGQQQGADLGSILGQLKPQGQSQSPMTKGAAMPGAEGKGMLAGGGGKSSL